MDGDVLYAVLMSCGWIFLVGWLALLVVACGLAFRPDPESGRQRKERTPTFASGTHKAVDFSDGPSPYKVQRRL